MDLGFSILTWKFERRNEQTLSEEEGGVCLCERIEFYRVTYGAWRPLKVDKWEVQILDFLNF